MRETTTILFVSYLLGCFTTGYYLVRLLRRDDIRSVASGNVGSRNVGRLFGIWGFVLTFLGDAGKGILAVWLANYFIYKPWVAVAALFLATAGHIWPIQLRFRGGKGFATFAGGMTLLQPQIFLLLLGICVILYCFMRNTTKTGLSVLAVSPLIMALKFTWKEEPDQMITLFIYTSLVAMILFAHRSNIRRFFPNTSDPGE